MNINQERTLRNKVNNEVLMLATSLVEDLLNNDLISWDEVENLYYNEELEELKKELENVTNEEETEELEEEIQYMEDNQELQDIFEWYFVSGWLYEKLRDNGEPVINCDYGYIWGRTCTGQAIILDYVIQQIFK